MEGSDNQKVYARLGEALAFALLDHARNRAKETQDEITRLNTELASVKLSELNALAGHTAGDTSEC